MHVRERLEHGIIALLGVLVLTTLLSWQAAAQTPSPGAGPPFAVTEQSLPATVGPRATNTQTWSAIRYGLQGTVSVPEKRLGILVQAEGQTWRMLRNGPLRTYGGWLLAGTLVVLAVYFMLRGRLRLEGGAAGKALARFSTVERSAHWLTAVSFILLALTGLNMLYGRAVLLPVLGQGVFSDFSATLKYVHNFLGFAFIAGLLMVFVLWVRDNLPQRHDLVWLVKGGGMFGAGAHPPADRFNAGEKLVFWFVVLGGAVLSLTGLLLLFPFFFVSPLYTLLAQLAHSATALVLTAVIIAHIYLGSVGMEGAFSAMWTGVVDVNWARTHHSIWYRKLTAGSPDSQADVAAVGEDSAAARANTCDGEAR